MRSRRPINSMVLASMFGAATAVGAYIMIPLPLVPITLQTFFLNLAAALLGGYQAALSQVVYVILGLVGLPVFTGGKSGVGVLFGPSGGYLIGFIAGAWTAGTLIRLKKTSSLPWTILSMVAGMFVIYIFGIAQLCLVADLSVVKAVTVGALPFIPGDLVKIAAAALVARKIGEQQMKPPVTPEA